VFGSTVVRAGITILSRSTWLWICLVLAVWIISIGQIVNRLSNPRSLVDTNNRKRIDSSYIRKSSPVLAGAWLVYHSRYLLSIVGIVGLYEMVSTIMDFQFSATVAHFLDGKAMDQQFADVFAITNISSMVIQLFLTSFIMRRFGVKIALLVLPFAVLSGSCAFIAAPLLWPGSLLNTVDNAFSYSINQSAKEALYVPTSEEEKYQAKAFIDMAVQRFAKALAVLMSFGITIVVTDFSTVRWLSLVTVALAALWLLIASYVGSRFDKPVESEAQQALSRDENDDALRPHKAVLLESVS
jgi:ATP:ADP antiporter, AAA family